LIHRDLKPENIFLVPEDDHEIAKVLDFGIAKTHAPLLDNATTKAGALLGTPHYMSPEQAQGTKQLDYRSDLWSLGVLAFQCLTGKLPFNSEALGDLLLHIMVNPLPVPSQIAPDVPPTFDIWWQRAAARLPEQRFQSAKELADALAIALGLTVAMQPGMVPFSPLSGSGLFVIAGAPSMSSIPSITPPAPGAPMFGAPVNAANGGALAGHEFDADTMLGKPVPTTGPAVTFDGQRGADGERISLRGGRVPLGLGVAVAVGALLAGVGLAFWGRSYFQAQTSSAAQASTVAAVIPPVPPVVRAQVQAPGSGQDTTPAATPGGEKAAPSSSLGAADRASGAGATTTAPAAAPSGSSAPKLPLKPRKPKEKDFGF
jgi:serine/threonine-protein kinase